MGPLPKELRATEDTAFLVDEDGRRWADCFIDPDSHQDNEAMAYELARRYNEEPRLRAAIKLIVEAVGSLDGDDLRYVVNNIANQAINGEDS